MSPTRTFCVSSSSRSLSTGGERSPRSSPIQVVIPNDIKITPQLVAEHGLKPDEYQRFLHLIGREPSITELGIVSAMWNEHCSYKSSKIHLKTLPTKAPWVIQGPGENAGVIDIGDGLAVVFKMESHNHPSFIEPYQGAATGVGGILRDVFTMGARPIAVLDALRFGDPRAIRDPPSGLRRRRRHRRLRQLLRRADGRRRHRLPPRYDGNILVNAMAVGLAKPTRSSTPRPRASGRRSSISAPRPAATASMARPWPRPNSTRARRRSARPCRSAIPSPKSCCSKPASRSWRPAMSIAIQDMGAAGLTCSAVEMGAKGDLGVELDLDAVPCREDGMSAYEMMLSESQERMLMVIKPGHEEPAEAIFRKWGLDFAVVGQTTDTLRFVVKHQGETMADLPIKELGDEAPEYDRPWVETPKPAGDRGGFDEAADVERRGAAEAGRLARSLVEALDLPSSTTR
jgi:phosphoribosylformylglycinamidine (FGAM) synthase-like enzyme